MPELLLQSCNPSRVGAHLVVVVVAVVDVVDKIVVLLKLYLFRSRNFSRISRARKIQLVDAGFLAALRARLERALAHRDVTCRYVGLIVCTKTEMKLNKLMP